MFTKLYICAECLRALSVLKSTSGEEEKLPVKVAGME